MFHITLQKKESPHSKTDDIFSEEFNFFEFNSPTRFASSFLSFLEFSSWNLEF